MRKLLLATLFLFCFISLAYGIRRDLVGTEKIDITDATIGTSYSLKETTGLYYELTNYIRDGLHIQLEATIPPKFLLLRKGYEPLPDISWIRLEKDEFTTLDSEKIKIFRLCPTKDRKDYRFEVQFSRVVKKADISLIK